MDPWFFGRPVGRPKILGDLEVGNIEFLIDFSNEKYDFNEKIQFLNGKNDHFLASEFMNTKIFVRNCTLNDPKPWVQILMSSKTMGPILMNSRTMGPDFERVPKPWVQILRKFQNHGSRF